MTIFLSLTQPSDRLQTIFTSIYVFLVDSHKMSLPSLGGGFSEGGKQTEKRPFTVPHALEIEIYNLREKARKTIEKASRQMFPS